MDTGATTIGFDFDDTNSKTIGPYRLVRQIGEGGMGVVYHAQQLEPIRRDVALKVIKPGMDTKQVIARFENERQALAVMDHPNIAHVFDAGATSNGRPYFVMELVDGIPITEYCDSKRLSITERIELLISVCEAIHHAHQKGIIHRDIKPSNILIVEYEEKRAPKVIDFGIAKALGQQLDAATMMTNIGVAMGTPDYMSPEQADLTRHDVDTRSDVYSLGAVLYELLTGTTPLKRQSLQNTGYVDVLERIRTEEPERPSTRSRLPQSSAEIASLRRCDPAKLPKVLQGDLDWIAMKALEKDRARRYESVNGLKRDLERYLRGDAVEAGPPSRTYRLSKFVRRHRAWLAAGATFVALLVSAVVVSSWLAIRASRAEQFALTESATAKAVNEFLRHDVLAQASANVQAAPGAKPDPELTVRTALDRAASRIAGKFDAQPMVEASIRQTISNAYRDLGLYSEAQQHSERALELLRRVHGQTHPLVLTAMKELTELYTLRGQYPEAERLYSQVPELHRKLQGAEHPETLDSLETLASLYVSQGKLSQAESLFSTVLEVRRRVLGQEHPDTMNAMNSLAIVYMDQGKYALAEPLSANVVQVLQRVRGEEHPETLTSMNSLAEVYRELGKYALAEPLQNRCIELKRRVLGEEHPSTLSSMNNLALVYQTQGKYEQAESLFAKILEVRRRTVGEEHPDTLTSMNTLAATLRYLGKYDQAESLGAKTVELRLRALGEEHPATLRSQGGLAITYREQEKYAQAESLFNKILSVQRRLHRESAPETLGAQQELALLYSSQGRNPEADALLTAVLERRRSALGSEHPITIATLTPLGWIKLQQRDFESSRTLLQEALKAHEKANADTWQRSYCQSLLGAALMGQKKYEEAERLLLSGYQQLLQRAGTIPYGSRTNVERAGTWIVQLYEQWGKKETAEAWRQKLRNAPGKPTAAAGAREI